MRITSASKQCGPTDAPEVAGTLSGDSGGASVELVDANGTPRGKADGAFVHDGTFEAQIRYDFRIRSGYQPLPVGGLLRLRDAAGKVVQERPFDLSGPMTQRCG